MSIGTVIKVAGNIPASVFTSSIVSIDVPEDGLIMGVQALMVPNFVPAVGIRNNLTSHLVAELSFNSTHQININDARGTIAGIGVAIQELYAEATETGGGSGKFSETSNLWIDGGLIVNAGERIHMHGSSSGLNLTADVTFLMYLKTSGGGRRALKRR
jgi:hypothetical protein